MYPIQPETNHYLSAFEISSHHKTLQEKETTMQQDRELNVDVMGRNRIEENEI